MPIETILLLTFLGTETGSDFLMTFDAGLQRAKSPLQRLQVIQNNIEINQLSLVTPY